MADDSSAEREARTVTRRLRHELRTPVGQIIGYAEMLEEEAEDRDQQDLVPDLQKIQGAARKLLALIDETLLPGAEAETRAPEAADTAAAPAAEGSDDATPASEGGHVLVVDDEPQNRDMLSRRLERQGYTTETASDGPEALRAVEAGDYDLVVLDVMMPGMTGFEVLRTLRQTRRMTDLPVILATALGGSDDIIEGFRSGANDYVTKPIDLPVLVARMETHLRLRRTARAVEALARQLEVRNAFIRRAFGRYVSDEVVDDLLSRPEALDIQGEKRRVTVLMTDLRGFTAMTETLSAAEVVSVLNHYLGAMAEVVQRYHGTVDKFIGDAVLAFFGAPTSNDDDALRAITCAVAMQCAMPGVNELNRASGLPEIEMGIGIATGDAIVGNVGSEQRANYTAIGSTVNLTARIESYTVGGQVLVSDAAFAEAGEAVRVEESREVHPKGFEKPIRIHRVVGVGPPHDLALPREASALVRLEEEVPVRFALLEGKHVSDSTSAGWICQLSPTAAVIRAETTAPEEGDLRIDLVGSDGAASYGKVVGESPAEGVFTVRFTVRSDALREHQQALAR